MKNIKIAFFDTKPYDHEFFDKVNDKYGFPIKYFKGHLNHDTVGLTQGCDVVCAFVNDILDKKVFLNRKSM